MKSIMRCSAIFGLLASILVGSSLTASNPAWALPKQEIVKKLNNVLVFTVANEQGAPLVASVANDRGEQASVAGFFISQKDAQAFFEQIQQQNPSLAENARVVPVSLAEVYELNEANEENSRQLEFEYVPVRQQVQFALQELRESGQTVENFSGVPLFYATGGPDNGYLTIQQGNEQVIPLFFNKEQLEGMIDQLQQKQPDLASSVDIKVSNLQTVIEELESNNDPQLGNIVLVPPRETLEFLQSIQQRNGQQ